MMSSKQKSTPSPLPSQCVGAPYACVIQNKKRGLGGGRGGGRTALFLAIESCYFSQDGRKTLTFLLFVLISFVQGVASDLRKWGVLFWQ